MTHIRPEQPEDIASIDEITRLAFEGEEEAKLIVAIRNSDYFIPKLSLVTVQNNRVVGHILFSPITIESPETSVDALALAPMAVVPDFQNKGIGTKLVKHGLEACKKLGYTIVIVVGHPEYYPRLGFKPAREYGIEAPFEVPDDAFLVCELFSGALKKVRGMVKYSPAFDSVI
ncbi:MAG TPA: N-acetyltransferase [Candidatus Bathyarchaeia archaeon]|nr:N-acetyltransferase [Candidatus Bathyarchaeia archaeon]